jgi:hypothetical protein
LRVLLVGLFTFVLVIQVAAAATKAESTTAGPTARVAKEKRKALTLEQRLERSRDAARKYRGTIRFYENHRELLSSGENGSDARRKLRHAKQRLPKAERSVKSLLKAIAQREARRLDRMKPRQAICNVFGRYCSQAVNVAWCESRLSTTAQNGQYLGMFQMGSSERRLFGHGPTPHAQAVAAHRYFVVSGRDWSPWGCRWAAS